MNGSYNPSGPDTQGAQRCLEGASSFPQPHQVVDVRFQLCPLPLIRAEAAIQKLKPGEILSLRATDRGLERDLPAWCQVQGHRFIAVWHEGSELVGLVEKGP